MQIIRVFRSFSLVGATVLAAFTIAHEAGAAAPSAVSENVPIPGGLAALARALDIDAPDPARVVAELARVVCDGTQRNRRDPQSPYQRLLAHFATAGRQSMARPDVVPVPLTSRTWSQVLGRSLTSSTLFAAILSDPEAALLAHGLSALDDQTLEFFASHPSLLTVIYRQHATVFATFPAHLHVGDGRVLPPGGERAVALWEGALGQRAGNPVAFVTALYAKSGGRLAYLYDILGDLDESQRAFALGLWLPDPVMRAQRFNALARAAADLSGEWKPADVPFARPVSDLLMLLQRVQVEPSGAPRAPASQGFWSLALSGVRETVELSGMAGPAIDAAWLADALLDGVAEARGARLDQFAFGHRVFTSTGDTDVTAMVDAIRRFPRTPLLMLTLERIGVQRAATFAALARHAQKLTVLDAEQEQRALAQLQGTVALITRLVTVGTIDRAVAEGLLETLSRTPVDSDRGYLGAITAFLARDLGRAIGGPSSASLDERLLRALPGRPDRNPVMRISWEGQSYVFDLVASESARLRRFLEGGRGASLDAALSAYRTAAVLPSGDTRAGATDSLEAADVMTADALLSFAYAIAWRVPPVAARFDRELPRRHDFGLQMLPRPARARTAWAVPQLVYPLGGLWHVRGAVLGLEMALAPLALRKIDAAAPYDEPRLLATYSHAFVQSLGLLDEFALRDADAGAVADAIRRGERRVGELSARQTDAASVIGELAMDGWRARALRWSLAYAPEHVTSLFSLNELLRLGGSHVDAHRWGMSGLYTSGCLCTLMPPPALHTAIAGRPQAGLLAASLPDLHLQVAVLLRDLQLPAALARHALDVALQDLLVDARPLHTDDWLTLVRRARALSSERVADALAGATTAAGPLSPVTTNRRMP